MFPNLLRASMLPWLLLSLAGCGEDTTIRSYSIAKGSEDSSAGQANSSARPAQLLGVIVPHQESAWFLKLTDEPQKVEKLANDFRSLASSLSFNEDGTPTWSLAEGWQQRVLKQITYAQFSNADGATVTLTQLGANTKDSTQWQNYLMENINRWRQQLGLAPQEWSSIEPELEEVPAHSTETARAYFVSLIGRQPVSGGGSMGGASPPMSRPFGSEFPQSQTGQPQATQSQTNPTPSTPTTEAAAPPRPRLVYQVPEGWQEQPAAGIRLASFQIPSESQMGTVSVSTAGGQMEQSVAMWMQQVGLEPTEELVKQTMESAVKSSAPIGNFQCFTIDGNETETGAQMAAAIRIAVIPLNELESLFVKMTGTKELIAAEVPKFDQFVQSLHWQ